MKHLLLLAVSLMVCTISLQGYAADLEPIVITGTKTKPQTFMVEVVSKDTDRARGLMNRKELKDDHGMLFLFEGNAEAAFWMKNTLIPLDMIFINTDGTIRAIHPMAEPNSRKIIKSGGPVVAGLEIKGGEARKRGLKPGDIVHYKVFGNELDKR